MSRFNRSSHRSDDQSLDLAPFMNIVAILIPMLLLSVVFMKAGVIDVSSPSLEGPPREASSKEKLDLSVAITEQGFTVRKNREPLPPSDECPPNGPTICLADGDVDVGRQLERARRALDSESPDRAEQAYDRAIRAYDFAELYNRMKQMKADHPNQNTVQVTASPELPYRLVVRIMDAIRIDRQQGRYASNEAFWKAEPKTTADGHVAPLFSQPVVAVAR